MENCCEGTAVPEPIVEPCGNTYISTNCVTTPESLIYLDFCSPKISLNVLPVFFKPVSLLAKPVYLYCITLSPIFNLLASTQPLLITNIGCSKVQEKVLKLDNLNKDELIEGQREIFEEFYQNPDYEKRMKSKIERFPHLKKSYDEFLNFLKQQGVLK